MDSTTLSTGAVLAQYVKNPKLRMKALITLAILAIYIVVLQIPGPGVDTTAVAFCSQQLSGWAATVNTLSGGAIVRLSPFAIGIIGYITAAIMWMLVERIIPALKNNPDRAKKIGLWFQGIVGTLLVAGTAFATAIAAHKPGGLTSGCSQTILPGPTSAVWIAGGTMLAGSLVLVGAATILSRKGVYNGFSLLIFTGICVGIPTELARLATTSTWVVAAGVAAVFVLLWIVATLGTTKKYKFLLYPLAGEPPAGDPEQPSTASVSIPLNPSGLVPLVLASIVASAPTLIYQFSPDSAAGKWVHERWGTVASPWHLITLVVLVFLLVFYQVIITYSSDDEAAKLSEDRRGFANVEEGEPTRKYFDAKLLRITAVAAAGLALLGCLPELLGRLLRTSATIPLGGASLLVAVMVAVGAWQAMAAAAGGKEAPVAPSLLDPRTHIPIEPATPPPSIEPEPATTVVPNRAERRAAARAGRKKSSATKTPPPDVDTGEQ